MAAYSYKVQGICKCPAQIAGEICEGLEQNGGLSPKRLLDASRDENAPLHGEFEWDDTIAAEKYRERQAQTIINNLTVRIETSEKETVQVRGFICTHEQESRYRSIGIVVQDKDHSERLMQEALRDMKSFRDRYSVLEQLSGVFSAMDMVEVGE